MNVCSERVINHRNKAHINQTRDRNAMLQNIKVISSNVGRYIIPNG